MMLETALAGTAWKEAQTWHRGTHTVAVDITDRECFGLIQYCDGLCKVDADADWLLGEARRLLARRLEKPDVVVR